jgi:membrane protease YdiL (CAAX protease family)
LINSLLRDRDSLESHRPWNFWATIGFGLMIGAAASAAQFLAVAIVFAVWLTNNPGTGVDHLLNVTHDYMGLIVSVSAILGAIVGMAALMPIIRLRGSVTEYLGLRRMGAGTIATLIGIILVFVLISDAASRLLDKSTGANFQVDAYSTSVLLPLLWISLVVFVPVFEEVIFRGFLFEGFRRSRIGVWGALILTSVIWSSLHIQYDFIQMAVIFVTGLLLGFVRVRTGSLWSTILMHAIFNLVAMAETALYLSGRFQSLLGG